MKPQYISFEPPYISIHPLFPSLDYVGQVSMGTISVPLFLPLPSARFYIDSRKQFSSAVMLESLGPTFPTIQLYLVYHCSQ